MKKFIVFSPGLSGLHMMIRCLEKTRLRQVSNASHHVHTRIVPKISPCGILYLYADPRNILLCTLKRSLERVIQPKLRQEWGPNSDIDLWQHCNRMEGDKDFVARNADNIASEGNIEFILNANYDPMKLEEHFTNWLTAEVNYPLMMLKYEALANRKTYQEVLNFFGVKKGRYHQEEWRPRSTSYLKLPLEQQVQITKLFKNLLKIQAEIPPIYIR